MGIDSSKLPLDVGIYSYPDAARLLATTPRELRRWFVGRKEKVAVGDEHLSAPLWKTQLSAAEIDGIGFRDLLEARLVAAFRKHGISLQAIRYAILEAKNLSLSDYPFTCREFLTDGRRIFAKVQERTGDESLIDIVKHQHVFNKIIEPSLYEGIDFDQRGGALRWFPVPRSKLIVIDPAIKFGQPVVAGSGVPISTLADAFKAERGNLSRVAKLFDVSRNAVAKAVKFADRLASQD